MKVDDCAMVDVEVSSPAPPRYDDAAATQLNGDHLDPVPDEDRLPLPRRTWQNARIVDKSTWFKVGSGKCGIRLNPKVTLIAILAIVAFVLYCILDDNAGDNFAEAKKWISVKFSWFYIGSQDVWAIAIIAIYFSKYGNIKLGKDDEEPEYSDGTWFAMLYACGVAVGLFFFGVAEPVWHYVGPNRYTRDKYMPDNELAQIAMNLTFFHWGIHGWIVYVVMGMMLGFLAFRKDMPMTMKSCFYPLIGDRIYGWIGDFIDILSIITTLFGVCTSLGLGTIQVNQGLNYINEDIKLSTDNQIIIIWCITFVATISVITGIGVGIRRLSEVCFGLGMVIMLMCTFLDDIWFILNLYCQSIGYYIQYIIQLGFHCDAFELLDVGSHGAADRGREYEDLEGDGPANWMDDWTIFYWGWWISWSPFVGMFIAKISRGRTIRQFINGMFEWSIGGFIGSISGLTLSLSSLIFISLGSLTAPMIYSFLWLTVFGGAGIRMERRAAEAGLCCPNFKYEEINGYVTNSTEMSNLLNKFSGSVTITNSYLCGMTDKKEPKPCNPCAWDLVKERMGDLQGKTETEKLSSLLNIIDSQHRWIGRYRSADDKSVSRLSCMTSEEMWFALVSSYKDMGGLLRILSLIGIVLYFVTSSDSGSLVIDIMSANGDQDPPIPQRVFWALVEGATATALLVAGGREALNALRTASVVAGLPYTIILCFVTLALWRALSMETGDMDPYGNDFGICVVDPFAKLQPKLWVEFIVNIFLSPLTLLKVVKRHSLGGLGIAISAALCWTLFVMLMIVEIVGQYDETLPVEGLYSLAWVFYLGYVTLVTIVRAQIRSIYKIHGNPIEDFFAVMFMYPSVLVQLDHVTQPGGLVPLLPDGSASDGRVPMVSVAPSKRSNKA